MRLPRAFFLYILFFTVSFSLLLTSLKITPQKYRAWRDFFLYVLSPFMWSAEHFIKENFDLPGNIKDVIKARSENEFLKMKLIEYEGEVMQNRELASENEFLRKALGLSQKLTYRYIISEVVLMDPNSWSLSLMVSGGTDMGIKKDSAVVSLKDGRFVLVGKIIEVFNNSSEVMLLTNPMFSVWALIPDTGCDGLLEHLSGNNMVLNYPSLKSAPLGADVVVGPLSKIFPSGLLLGKIIDNRNRIVISPEFLKLPLNQVIIIERKN